jgi:DNA-binding MarR family transcriptional regulator
MKNNPITPSGVLTDDDYRTLAAIRVALRRFAHFSESAAKTAGLKPQQHQALLAIRASPNGALSIGELAEFLLIQPHSASELADRLRSSGLAERKPDDKDRRMAKLHLTPAAEETLLSLSVAHRYELLRLRPLLTDLLTSLGETA